MTNYNGIDEDFKAMLESQNDVIHQSLEASIRRAKREAELSKPVILLSKEELKNAINEPLNMKEDPVNPNHYKSTTSLECIEAMEMVFGRKAVVDFCMCNAWKYIWRWKHKNGQEDLNKAKWYLKKSHELRDDVIDDYSLISDRMFKYITDNEEKDVEEATK